MLCLEISAELLPIADPDEEGTLLAQVAALRFNLADDLGYIMPSCRILDNSELDSYEYRISVRQQTVGTGYVYPNRYMVNADEWNSQAGGMPENAIIGVDPLNGEQRCYWVDKEDTDKYPAITALEPVEVIKKHLRQLVIRYVDSIISTYDIEKYFETANKIAPSQKITEKLKERLDFEDIRQVFINLIKEEVSIKDILFVFDRLSNYSRRTKEPYILSELLRGALCRQICLNNVDREQVLYVLTLSPEWEKKLGESLQIAEHGAMFLLNLMQLQDLIESTTMTLERAHKSIGQQPVILCSPRIRLPLYQLLEKHIPTIVVITYSELISIKYCCKNLLILILPI